MINSKEDIAVVIDKDWENYWRARNEDLLDDAETLRVEPNGKITVEGDLGIFHNNKSYPTFIEGDINNGMISGVWEEGDLIKIEINKVVK